MANSFKRTLTQYLALHLAVPLIYFLYRLIGFTLRRRGDPSHFYSAIAHGQRFVAAFWHDDSLHMAIEMQNVLRDGDVYIMSSPGRDGVLMARFLRLVGARVIPGSTTHGGGRGLLQMVHAMTPRDFAALAVDGSRRSPRFRVQEGVLLLARRSGLPIMPFAIRASRKWVVGSKDRIEIPWPFAQTTTFYGKPMHVPPNADAAELERLRLELENEMREMKGIAAQGS